ncbi:MAG TPA: cytochrome c3 family protein [Gemmataceae bacterium]|nr:cytochrome c3 family protein [Gemmataceae bacterium]
MPQIFHRSFNTISKVSIFGAVFILAGAGWAYARFIRSSYATGVNVAREQPVPFSHRHHVSGLGIDCRYCHTSVEDSKFAGLPPTKTCMNCHSQIWTNSPLLEPVRESYRTGQSIRWNRVHNLANFVYFDHSIHVKKGVGCATCHGPVHEMPLTWQHATLHMEWCLDCHRTPERYIRPREQVFNMTWEHPPNQIEEGLKLMQQYKIERRTDCSVCHR